MKRRFKQILRETPLYHPYSRLRWHLRRARQVSDWKRAGRPAPPPDLVKERIIRSYRRQFDLRILVETGTYMGDMIAAMKNDFDHIYSIELSEQLHEKARQRFAGCERIHLLHGDSGVELGKLIGQLGGPTLFWLDGHYSGGITAKGDKETPIHEELLHVLGDTEADHVILVDDARCFGNRTDYPTIEQLAELVASKRPNAVLTVEDDIIRITPT